MMYGSGDDSKHIYVTLFSKASARLYQDNMITTFMADLAPRQNLVRTTSAKCGYANSPIFRIKWVRLKTRPFKASTVVGDTTGLIKCDFISPQYVAKALVRCLRMSISGQHAFDKFYYLPIQKRTIKNIRILKLTDKHVELKSGKTPTNVVFHFPRVSPW